MDQFTGVERSCRATSVYLESKLARLIITKNSSRFYSKIDKKGRALLSAEIRKDLGLKFGTNILVIIFKNSFETKVDERGRFGIPAFLRKGKYSVKGIIKRISTQNGCDSTTASMLVCGTRDVSATSCLQLAKEELQASLARGPILKTKTKGGNKYE